MLRQVVSQLASGLSADAVREAGRAARRTWQETRDAYRAGLAGEPPPDRDEAADDRQAATPRAQRAQWYADLEIPDGSDLETVRRAWKRLARAYHPDRFATDPLRHARATELWKRLHQSYIGLAEHLSDER
ncbi:MAG: J domain-containing protein [Acidobacteriota bacterium]